MVKMVEIEPETKIKGLGIIYRCNGNPHRISPNVHLEGFDKKVEALHSEGLEVITASQLAYARINSLIDRNININGTYVREGVLYIPNDENKIYLLRYSLVLKHLQEATLRHYYAREFIIKYFNWEEYISLLPPDKYLLLNTLSVRNGSIKQGNISTREFGNDPRTKWLFGEIAEEYGLFLRSEYKISDIRFNLHTIESIQYKGGCFANQLFHYGSRGNFEITGYDKYLDYSDKEVCGLHSGEEKR